MSVATQLTFEDDEQFESLAELEERETRERKERQRTYRRNHKSDPRKITQVPIRNGQRYCIVPEIAPIFEELAARAALDISQDGARAGMTGVNILAARAAMTMGRKEAAVVRRLYAVLHRKQLFINTTFVENVLISMDAEHDYEYGAWPSCRADALEIVADFAEGKYGPSKLLKKANRLYEKGLRKALKRAVELNP